MRQRRSLLPLLLCAALTGCAIYDTERGVFVSSSPQTASVSVSASLEPPLNLLAFEAPLSAPVAEESRVAVAGGAFIPITFKYRFDEVDQANLRRSLIGSFGSGPHALVDVAKDADLKTLKGTVISIQFRQAGVNPGPISTTCIIDTVISIARGGKISSLPLVVEGSSSLSVASAKNDALKKYVVGLAGVVNGQQGAR